MKKIYLSHPYTGDEERRRAEAAKIQRDLQGRFPDMIVLNPLAMFAALEDVPYEQVMEYCLAELQDCDLVVMAGDYLQSEGCLREYNAAYESDIPVKFYVGVNKPLSELWIDVD